MIRSILKIGSSGFVLLLMLTILVPMASAATPTPSPIEPNQRYGMEYDCAKMTGSVLAYAISHGYCEVGKDGKARPKTGTVQPQNTVTGSCGYTDFSASDAGGSQAWLNEHAHSYNAPIVYVNKTINYYNYTYSYPGYNAQGYVASGDWYNNEYLGTGHGFVSFTLGGTVNLAWGGSCTIIPNGVNATIT